MEKYRDVFGNLEYELGDFFVPHRTGNTGQYRILKHEPWYVTDARYNYNLWDTVPPFDSFIQAVRYLKENIGNLM